MTTEPSRVRADLTVAAPVQLLLPLALPGTNGFASPGWWGASDARLLGLAWTEEEYAAGRAATLALPSGLDRARFPHRPEETTVLAVAAPVREWLTGDTEQRLARLDAWADELLAWTSVAPVTLLASSRPPEDLAELLAAAAGVRLTPRDTGEPAPGVPADRYADALRSRLSGDTRAARIGRRLGAGEAIASVTLATDAVPGVPVEDAARLRAATSAVLERLAGAGVRVRGARELLRWPVPAPEGRVPADVAADAVLAVLDGVLEGPAFRSRRAEAGGGLHGVPARELLKLLGRRAHG